MTNLLTDHSRGCQGREYTCTCGYDAQREWQDISTAPLPVDDEWVRILVWVADGGDRGLGTVAFGYKLSSGRARADGYLGGFNITHWMPLPSPPNLSHPLESKRETAA